MDYIRGEFGFNLPRFGRKPVFKFCSKCEKRFQPETRHNKVCPECIEKIRCRKWKERTEIKKNKKNKKK